MCSDVDAVQKGQCSFVFVRSRRIWKIGTSVVNMDYIFNMWSLWSPHVRESKELLDSGFHAVDSGFHLLDSRSFSVELGFRIRIVSGIPDSYTCIPDSKAQDSGFHKQKFPRFRIPNAKISRIPESGFLYMGRFMTNANVSALNWVKFLKWWRKL